jgi:hypothetical protein
LSATGSALCLGHLQHVGPRRDHPALSRRRPLLYGAMNANHTPHERRYTVNEAAEILGISAEAVRARIKRGTLRKEKDEEGTVYVRLNTARPDAYGRPNGDATDDHTVPESKAFELMQEQVDYLRGQLEVWQEEARRKDHIIAALTERIPELEAPTEPREHAETSSETSSETSARGDDDNGVPEAERRPWWRRWFS